MGKFFAGFAAAIVLLAGGFYVYAHLGFIDPGADARVSSFETNQAMAALDRSIERRAPAASDAVAPDEANVTAGMRLFQSNCAGCHGDVNHPESPLAESFYPRAPQFRHEKPDMAVNENFFVIKHGIRWSGMPAWKQSLSDRQIWQVCAFLSQMDKLSAPVEQQWRDLAK